MLIRISSTVFSACCLFMATFANADPPNRTSLTNPDVRYKIADEHYVVLKRNGYKAIIVDNSAVDTADLPGHRAGYNGLASLTHLDQAENVFVPSYAGLNFEHIHDGTTVGLVEKFEPRKFPMQLRVIDEFIVEVYQPPTGNWQLESCGRYAILPDGVIEYTFECIPRANHYARDFIGLFWASYIHQPEDKSIFFKGSTDNESSMKWINAVTPSHGVASTHRPNRSVQLPLVDPDFPLSLVNHPSDYVVSDPWYYGVSRGWALVQMFREQDQIWIAQSPSGGGNGNPAWDFQWFIREPKAGQSYGFVMRIAYLPYVSAEQIESRVQRHLSALNIEPTR